MFKEKYSLKSLKFRELWKSEIKTGLQHSSFQRLQTALFAYGCLSRTSNPFVSEGKAPATLSPGLCYSGSRHRGSGLPGAPWTTPHFLQPLLWTLKDKKHKKGWKFQKASSNKKIVNGTTNKKANLVQKICLFYFPFINIAPKVNLSPCSHKAHPGLLKCFTLGLPNKSNKNNDTIIPLLSLFSVLHLQIWIMNYTHIICTLLLLTSSTG